MRTSEARSLTLAPPPEVFGGLPGITAILILHPTSFEEKVSEVNQPLLGIIITNHFPL